MLSTIGTALLTFCARIARVIVTRHFAEGIMRRVHHPLLAVVLALFPLTAPAAAQNSSPAWPQRPVRLLVTLGPGSGVDIGTRLLADRLSARWGQPVVVENRPGGDGIVAIAAFVAAHDDHVLLSSPTSSFTAHPFIHDNLPYKPSDLLPIVRVSNTVVTSAVPISLNVGSLSELVALARKQPGKLNWASVTGALDFLFAGFLKSTGVTMTKVPYRNLIEAANDLAEGRVQVYQSAFAAVRSHLQSGKIKVLAVTNSVRAPMVPDVPTVKEAGYPELNLDGLVGFLGPSDMPAALRERIAADVRAVAADPIIGERLAATGQILNIGGPAEFAADTDAQRAHIAAVAAELGIKPTQ
jgi:tripartite-type tricarboxylate transporter receptor subunit TctC